MQYIMYHSNYWLNFKNLWVDWPDREMNGLFKWYYLVQFAFCLQQILVVNIEERRKDYVQMFTHHLITCSLMLTSYGYHQTKAGNVVLCVMDCVDIIFPVSSAVSVSPCLSANNA
jgi:acyl-CoA-dependent ceramide synthase